MGDPSYVQSLTEEYERGLPFNYFSGYISALKNYLRNYIVDTNVVKKIKKGLFKLRPLKTKYHATWDVNILLNFLENMSTDSDMYVSRKLVCLFMLLSGSYVNLISHLNISNMYLTDTECTFLLDDVLKHSRPSFKEKRLVFGTFPQNPKLCPVCTLIQYLDTRLSRSSNTALFLFNYSQAI